MLEAAANLRRLLVVDPCDDCRRLLPGLRAAGWEVDSCALETARERACDVGLLRLRPFHLERPETVKDLISRSGTEWIAVLSPDTLPLNGVGDFVCEWFFDFHTLPFDVARVQVTLGRAFGMARLRGRGTVPGDAEGEHELLGESRDVRDLRQLLAKLAPTDSPGADPGRKRHRQGAGGAHPAPAVAAGNPALRGDQLRGDARAPDPVGAVRPREGRLHRGASAQGRADRGGRRRHPVPRRGRRSAAGAAGQPVARAPGEADRAGWR